MIAHYALARRIQAVALLSALATLGCGGDSPSAPVEQLGADADSYWPGTSWRTAQPAQVGVNGAAIATLVSRLRRGALGTEHALVIVRKGYVITDEYFASWHPDSVHTEQSVTKSVLSLIAGIAISRGDVRGVRARPAGQRKERRRHDRRPVPVQR